MNLSLLHALASEPWYISETTHAELLSEAFSVAASPSAEPDLAKIMGIAFPQRPAATLERDTGIAHIHVFGPVSRNLPPLQRTMGKTDFAQIHDDFATAKAAGASGILLHVDSPGGTVNGTPEAAALVSGTTLPVVVHAQRAASAGYYIAAGADRIFASPSAEVGSIGVMFPRVNLAAALEKAGIKAETITNTAGDLKNISSTSELTPAQRAHIQEEADGMFAAFRDHILNHRTVGAGAMRGQTFSGQAALAANLIDELGTPADARASLIKLISAGSKKLAA